MNGGVKIRIENLKLEAVKTPEPDTESLKTEFENSSEDSLIDKEEEEVKTDAKPGK